MGLVVRTTSGKILDLCAAPGGFLAAALETNPGSKAKGFSLPPSQGGHKLILRHTDRSQVEFLDLTMLAADLGVTDIPPEHPEADKFLPRHFEDSELFDLVICDGNVLRTHERLPYREVFEPVRLKCAQLALGLEHAANKGAVLVLLHNLESWETVCIIYRFQQFSRVQLFKPSTGHTTRSSFYMIANSIKRDHPAAVEAISHWKAIWRAATFGTDDDLARTVCDGEPSPRTVLQEFGERILQLGNDIWRVQADALTSAPFMSRK